MFLLQAPLRYNPMTARLSSPNLRRRRAWCNHSPIYGRKWRNATDAHVDATSKAATVLLPEPWNSTMDVWRLTCLVNSKAFLIGLWSVCNIWSYEQHSMWRNGAAWGLQGWKIPHGAADNLPSCLENMFIPPLPLNLPSQGSIKWTHCKFTVKQLRSSQCFSGLSK